MREVNQYFDNKDGMFHITFFTKIKSVSIINSLNYRIYSIELNDGRIIKDPNFLNSKYVFNIPSKMLNKEVFFNFSFSPNDIESISSFKFGLCDEKVRWYTDQFIQINNNFKNSYFLKEEIKDKKEEIKTIEEDKIINISIENNIIFPKEESTNLVIEKLNDTTTLDTSDFFDSIIPMETIEVNYTSDVSIEPTSLRTSNNTIRTNKKKSWKNNTKSK